MPTLEILDTNLPTAADVLAEAWHAVGMPCGSEHSLRACEPQNQVDIWSDVAHWMGFLHGLPLPLQADGWPILAEAMHFDCNRREDHRAHALVQCDSDGLRAGCKEDAQKILVWLGADPARRTGFYPL